MFVPSVPVVPHTTVVNKTIVYSDTVLPLKDYGSNLKVTSVSNVEEYSLESCLKTIFESNSNVVFNTIQYSESEKKVYFYTDTEISTKSWNDISVRTYKPLTSKDEIIEEVKRILVTPKNNDKDCISLYQIAKLIKNKKYQYERMKEEYQSHLDYIINCKYPDTSILVYDFDYDKSELSIGVKLFITYDKIRFAKRNGDLVLVQSGTWRGQDILVALGDKLLKLYDKFMDYKDFFEQRNYDFNSVNSNFLIVVSQKGVSIFTRSQSNKLMKDFELSSDSNNNEYAYECNSYLVIREIEGKEDEIFKRIFVKIDDCPKWCQPILYETRQNQLAEEKRIKDEEKFKEMKKQKRLELIRKIFPFLKK